MYQSLRVCCCHRWKLCVLTDLMNSLFLKKLFILCAENLKRVVTVLGKCARL